MAKKYKFGRCKLCGKETKLTFEHVPPEKAFNSFTVKKYSFEETIKILSGTREPNELKGKLQQRGSGDYYLCQQCNNSTGSWYMADYIKFVNTMKNLILQFDANSKACSFKIENFYPLKIFKAIMTMFCDINHECMGDPSLRDFLLNKDSTAFNHEKYSVYIYLTKSSIRRIQGISALHTKDTGLLCLTEISSFPIGLLLYIDKPKDYKPQGLMINDFAKANYDEPCTVDFVGLPLLEVNSHFIADFRTKQQIAEDYEQGQRTMEELRRKGIIK